MKDQERIVCGVDTLDLDDKHGLAAIIVCKIHPTGIIEVLENKTAKDRDEFNTYVQEIKTHYNCEVSEVGNTTRDEKHSKHSRLVDVTKLFEDKINFFIKKNEKLF